MPEELPLFVRISATDWVEDGWDVEQSTEPQHADEIITSGDADLVFIARELLREPYWALKAQHALGEEPSWPIPYGYAVKRRPR